MPSNGYPGDYPPDEPTQYGNYSDYSDQQPVPAPTPAPAPWYQRPAALVGLGVLTAGVLALLVYAVVAFTTARNTEPAVTTTTTTPSSSTASAVPAPATSTVAPEPTTTAAPTTITETTTVPSTASPTTIPTTTSAAPEPTTTTAPSPSVTTVTETTTKRLWPTLPSRLTPPTLYEPGQ